MLFEQTLSGAGRASGQTVNALRKQLGFGNEASASGSASSPKKAKAPGSNKLDQEAPAAGLEQLRKALREVMGENEEPVQAKVLHGDLEGDQDATLSPGQIRAKREKERPSAAFKAPSRNEKAKLDVEVRFRAPPLGTYRPKSGQSRPRLLGQADFGKKPGRAPIPDYGGELADGLPQKPPRHVPVSDFGKTVPRKTPLINFNVNSFTAGVLDGDLSTSCHIRSPLWDFSKAPDPQGKDKVTYFQPGQYNPRELDHPRLCLAFSKQASRKPMLDGLPAGNHLPDRSLSRSCPVLSQSRSVSVPDLSKYRSRDPFFKPASDNQSNCMTFDAMEANKALWRRPANVDNFDKSLDRMASLKGSRYYAQDVALKLAKDNETHGPVSVELLVDAPMMPLKRVNSMDFDTMAGRSPERQSQESSARARDQSKNMKFERETRLGETRMEAGDLSPLAGAIVERRSSRTFAALEASE